MTRPAVLVLVAIVLGLDATIGWLARHRLQGLFPRLPVRVLVFVESALAAALLAAAWLRTR